MQREDSCGAVSFGASWWKCREAEIAEEVTSTGLDEIEARVGDT